MSFLLGTIAALAAPLVMTLGFFIWEGLWKGSAFLLNLFKCSLASLVFILIVGCLNLSSSGAAFFSHGASTVDIAMLLLSSALGIVVGDTCWLKAMQILGARRVIVVDVTKPFLAAIVGFIGLSEPITWTLLAGLVLTTMGVLLVSLEKEMARKGGPGRRESDQGGKPSASHTRGGKNGGDSTTAAAKGIEVDGGGGSSKAFVDSDEIVLKRPSSDPVAFGYAAAVANVVFDVVGAFLTRRYGTGLDTFGINAIRFGSASAMLGVVATLLSLWRKRRGCGRADSARAGAASELFGPPGWRIRMTRRHWTLVSAGVMFVTVGCPALSNWALFQLPLGVCLCLTSVGPLYAIPMSYVFRREKITLRAVLGSMLACGGVVVLYLAGGGE